MNERRMLHDVYIGVGSNLGDRVQNIRRALAWLDRHPGIYVSRMSSWFETEPVGGPPQGLYLNGAVRIDTCHSPRALLSRMKTIESCLGREPGPRNRARTIDLDLLLYGREILLDEDLIIPHPRMQERLFVLEPLAQIAGAQVHPVLDQTIAGLLEDRLRQ